MSGELVLVLRVFLALALYLFLCLTLWMIWQDLKRAGFRAGGARVPAVRLELHGTGSGPLIRSYSQTEIMLGRDPICELRLDDEAISARHAKFSFHHSQWWIEDLHSTNGTMLNGVMLTTATVLTDGDEVRCGQVTVRVGLTQSADVLRADEREIDHG